MQLPDGLQPWRQWLEWFAPEHLPMFADLLGRLNPLLGPFRGRQQGGVPEPDGLGDLQRRGPYERLLSSEWLLADEVPDEFLRRAAAGEHLFVAPQYHARQANRLIVVLFDAGPLQLGAARLVHLALLILLGRRAQEAGAQLRWGILQQAPELHELDSPAQLRRLLNARTYEVVTDEHWQTWGDWLTEQQHDAGECWVVGQRLPRTDGKLCTHRAQVHRSLDGENLFFELQSSSTRRVSLPIPDEQFALQLLKGQFAGETIEAPVLKGSVPRVSLTLLPVIASAGTHIAMKMLDAPGVVLIKLPAAGQKKPLEIRRQLWNPEWTPLSLTFMHNKLGGVLSNHQQLSFWNMSGLVSVLKPEPDELKLPLGTASFLPAVWLRNSTTGRLFLLDNHGHLAFWAIATSRSPAKPRSGTTHYLADKVLGLAKVDKDRAAYVRSDAGRLYAHSINAEGEVSPAYVVGDANGVTQVLFAGGKQWKSGFGGCALLTVTLEGERWQLVAAPNASMPTQTLRLSGGWKAVGVWQQEGDDYCSMVVYSSRQQSVTLRSGDGQSRVLFTTSNPIAKISFCPVSGLIAALTSATRELLVYSLPLNALRLQIFCNETSDEHGEGTDA
ncbi:hypothetical protein K3169_14900 [Pseudomonas phytophila]|uniref:Uncharacterized protein n=1 Tax=Pseudomonas phytophila TaxID=2867264 RepID=A0ABY6F734_9PSED|nr:hypothetical protein [Pseudomonas phytophila]UXZ93687.1 hypothetical protein K3169_14900 [Pseudomonas phytophila]